jgi:guanosine-3',5'-bis(diphosphate) 3'-pyrophosphohydrolase
MFVAECECVERELRILDLVPLPSHEAFEAALHERGPWVAGIDFPFGLPRKYLEAMGQARTWRAYVEWISSLSRDAFEAQLDEYKTARPSGDKEHLRLTDRLAKSQSPMKLYGVPVAKMFFEGAPRLARSGATIVPVADGDPERVVIEAYPALVVRYLGVGAYKGVASHKLLEQSAARERIVDRLGNHLELYECRVSMTNDQRKQLVKGKSGDALDSVLCAVQAVYAHRRRANGYGIPADADPLEGWIIGSELCSVPVVPERDPDFGIVLRALDFAARKHRDQRRKDAEASPYINHPIALANVLWQEGGVQDPITIAAALLHDTIEDTNTSFDELSVAFGETIAAIVKEVTDDKQLDKAERKRLQVVHAAHLSPRAKLVKLADKICNLRDIASSPPAGWPLERKQEYFDWAKAVVDGLRGVHAALEQRFDEAYARRPLE